MKRYLSCRRWVVIFALLVMLATTLPYWFGYQLENEQWRYTGLLFGVEDGNSYIAKMLLGASGSWLFRTPYTPFGQNGVLAFLPYLLLGKLTAPPGQHEQLVALFHLFRIVGGILLTLAVYDFAAVFLKEERHRRLAVALAVLGGGLGWLAVFGLGGLWFGALPGMDIPLEFYSPETFGFLMIYGLPHLAVARALLLWGLVLFLAPQAAVGERRRNILGGLLWLLMGLMQPLTVVVGWAVLAVFLAVTLVLAARKKPSPSPLAAWMVYLRRALWMGLISAPIVLYTMIAFQLDPFLREWTAQNKIISPPVHHYLLAYGLLLPLAVLGVRKILREESWRGWLIVSWVAAFPLLAYAPYNLQRRLPEGVWVALVVLAVSALAPLPPLSFISEGNQPSPLTPLPEGEGSRIGRIGKGIYWGLSFLTTIMVFLAGLMGVQAFGKPLYRPSGEVQAFGYLAEHTRAGDVVLAAYDTSNALPAWAAVRTLVGHGPESIHLEEIQDGVNCFYRFDCADTARQELLKTHKVRFVLWGPEEKKLGDYDLAQAPFLKAVYQEGEYTIFEANR